MENKTILSAVSAISPLDQFIEKKCSEWDKRRSASAATSACVKPGHSHQYYVPSVISGEYLDDIFSGIHADSENVAFWSEMQIAKPIGRLCGAERPRCGASGQSFPR